MGFSNRFLKSHISKLAKAWKRKSFYSKESSGVVRKEGTNLAASPDFLQAFKNLLLEKKKKCILGSLGHYGSVVGPPYWTGSSSPSPIHKQVQAPPRGHLGASQSTGSVIKDLVGGSEPNSTRALAPRGHSEQLIHPLTMARLGLVVTVWWGQVFI